MADEKAQATEAENLGSRRVGCPLTGDAICPMEDVKKDLTSIQGSLVSLKKDVEIMAGTLNEHHKTLFGNGHEGLKTMMTKVSMKATLLLWLFGITIVALIGNIIAGQFK